MTDEAQLLARARQLDPAALRELHQQFYEPVARYIQFKVSDPYMVQDLSGEVFVRVLDGLRRGQGWRETPRAWIMGIARNVVADHYRKGSRVSEVELSDELYASDDVDPMFLAIHRERKDLLMRAMQGLTADQRDIISMRFLQGIDIQEVAAATGKSVGAVKALQHRALRALALRLQQLRM